MLDVGVHVTDSRFMLTIVLPSFYFESAVLINSYQTKTKLPNCKK